MVLTALSTESRSHFAILCSVMDIKTMVTCEWMFIKIKTEFNAVNYEFWVCDQIIGRVFS